MQFRAGVTQMKNWCFVIGPYRSDRDYVKQTNIMTAYLAAMSMWQKGYKVICPHKNTENMSGLVDEQYFLDGYQELLRHWCDTVVLCPRWSSSNGSIEEVKIALAQGFKFFEYNRHTNSSIEVDRESIRVEKTR